MWLDGVDALEMEGPLDYHRPFCRMHTPPCRHPEMQRCIQSAIQRSLALIHSLLPI
jgi:hypothetical protein